MSTLITACSAAATGQEKMSLQSSSNIRNNVTQEPTYSIYEIDKIKVRKNMSSRAAAEESLHFCLCSQHDAYKYGVRRMRQNTLKKYLDKGKKYARVDNISRGHIFATLSLFLIPFSGWPSVGLVVSYGNVRGKKVNETCSAKNLLELIFSVWHIVLYFLTAVSWLASAHSY